MLTLLQSASSLEQKKEAPSSLASSLGDSDFPVQRCRRARRSDLEELPRFAQRRPSHDFGLEPAKWIPSRISVPCIVRARHSFWSLELNRAARRIAALALALSSVRLMNSQANIK